MPIARAASVLGIPRFLVVSVMASEHTLYLVATPIGHLDDLSARAIATLKAVDVIYAEDTRHSRRLMQAHQIITPLQSLHEHNEAAQAASIAGRILENGSAALISDAGTPLISDPGYRLVNACVSAGVKVSPVPGACALIAALSASGLPTDSFSYLGFPPAKGAARQAWFERAALSGHTVVFYESPHRIVDAVQQLSAALEPERPLVVCRELTKRFETFLRGNVSEVLERLTSDPDQQRGEFVLVLGAQGRRGEEVRVDASIDDLIQALVPHLPPKTVARVVAELSELKRRDVYARVLALADQSSR